MKYDFEKLINDNMKLPVTPSDELNRRVAEQGMEVNMNKKTRYLKHFPRAAAALAVILATGGIAFAATNFWNRDVARQFGVAGDKDAMDSLGQQGFAQKPVDTAEGNTASVTDKDITVTILQTLADEYSAYVYFEVKYGDQYHVTDKWNKKETDDNIPFPKIRFTTNSGAHLSFCGGIADVKDANTVTYEYYLIAQDLKEKSNPDLTKRPVKNQMGKKINMAIGRFEFLGNTEPVTIGDGGNWNLSWDLSVGTAKHIYHLNRKLTLGKYKCTVKDAAFSPLSCVLTYECTDGKSLGHFFAIVKDTGEKPLETDKNNNIKVSRYVQSHEAEIDALTPKGMTNIPLDSMQIFLNGKEFDGMGGMGNGNLNCMLRQFDKILDLKKITGIRVAGKYISLENCAYDVIQ